MSFVLFCSTVYARPNFVITKINCDGKIFESTLENQKLIKEKGYTGDVQRGYLYKNEFYAIDHDNELVATRIAPVQTSKYRNFNKIWDKSFRLWKVVFVDDRKIIVGAKKILRNSTVEDQIGCNLFQFDRLKDLISEIPVTGCSNDYISIFQNAIFYTNQDGNIYVSNDFPLPSLKT